MKITAFNGSPRGRSSNTGIMVSKFLQGAENAGAETEQIFLSEKKIGNCMGCFKCWISTPGKCVIRDDIADLLEKVMTSDVIVMATPLYVDGVTGILKNFMDRMLPLMDPHFEKDENGECRHVKRYEKYPKVMVVSNCGMPGQEHFQTLKLHFRRMARNFHSEVVAEIYLDSGEMLKSPVLLLKPLIAEYKRNLSRAGVQFVNDGAISRKTSEKLAKPLIPARVFIREANKYWDRELAKLKETSPEEHK